MRRKGYELHRSDEVVAEGTPGSYGRRSMGGRVSHLHWQLVSEKTIKEASPFPNDDALKPIKQLVMYKLSVAKVQLFFRSRKLFLENFPVATGESRKIVREKLTLFDMQRY